MPEKESPFVSAIVVAAGNGTRMLGVSKQLYSLEGKPVIAHTIDAFLECDYIKEIIIVCKKDEQEIMKSIADKYMENRPCKIVMGGETRQESVFCGVKSASTKSEYFAIHDGVRPLITGAQIGNCIELAVLKGAAALGVKVKDTIKIVSEDGMIVSTPDRNALFAIQTPQVFRAKLYLSAMEKATQDGKSYTDDCQLIENIGEKVSVCRGSYENIKITTQEDMFIAEAIINYRKKGL